MITKNSIKGKILAFAQHYRPMEFEKTDAIVEELIKDCKGLSNSDLDVLLTDLHERLNNQKLLLHRQKEDTYHDKDEYHMMLGKHHLLIELIKFYSK